MRLEFHFDFLPVEQRRVDREVGDRPVGVRAPAPGRGVGTVEEIQRDRVAAVVGRAEGAVDGVVPDHLELGADLGQAAEVLLKGDAVAVLLLGAIAGFLELPFERPGNIPRGRDRSAARGIDGGDEADLFVDLGFGGAERAAGSVGEDLHAVDVVGRGLQCDVDHLAAGERLFDRELRDDPVANKTIGARRRRPFEVGRRGEDGAIEPGVAQGGKAGAAVPDRRQRHLRALADRDDRRDLRGAVGAVERGGRLARDLDVARADDRHELVRTEAAAVEAEAIVFAKVFPHGSDLPHDAARDQRGKLFVDCFSECRPRRRPGADINGPHGKRF